MMYNCIMVGGYGLMRMVVCFTLKEYLGIADGWTIQTLLWRNKSGSRKKKARKRGKVFNWETAKYGKIWYDGDIYDLKSVETEFPAIAFNDGVSSKKTLSCEPTVSSLNDEIDFRISFDDSDDEDYTVMIDKNSFSYKIISVNNMKTDLENDNEKVNMPSFLSPEPTVSCFNDLDFFKDFKNEFPAIVYNDAPTSKSDLLTEPSLNPQHIDKIDLKYETSLSEYDEEEQNVLYFNDLFPFNIIQPDDLKSKKDNDDIEVDIIQALGGNEITQGSNMLFETSHDKINKTFRTGSFVMNLKVNIAIWNYYVNRMLFYLIMNLYVSFGIPFDPKRYYKDGDCARMLQRPRWESHEITYHDHDELEYENETHDERQELCETHELPMCNMRRFKMIKYSFGQDEEYVAIKEDEYSDLE
ncbi:hypothetical protein Tco_1146755 [Tanacetum coccineum]